MCVFYIVQGAVSAKIPEKFLRESGKPAFSKALEADDTMLLQHIMLY